MKDNIEKLYELAGVEKTGTKFSCSLSDYCSCEISPCLGCDKGKIKEYPPFTDTKQLELIKWVQLLDNIDSLQLFFHMFNNRWCLIVEMLPEFSNIPTERLHCSHEQFEQALAGLVCELWEDLTPEQKAEIKRILE